MKKIISVLLLILFTFCSTPQREYYVPQKTEYIGHQSEVLYEVNIDRGVNGLSILIPEKKLTEIAKDYAITLNATGVYNHRFVMDRYAESGAKYFGEVIAVNYITAASEMSAFQTSLPHINILRNSLYTHIGIYKEGNCLYICLAGYYSN